MDGEHRRARRGLLEDGGVGKLPPGGTMGDVDM